MSKQDTGRRYWLALPRPLESCRYKGTNVCGGGDDARMKGCPCTGAEMQELHRRTDMATEGANKAFSSSRFDRSAPAWSRFRHPRLELYLSSVHARAMPDAVTELLCYSPCGLVSRSDVGTRRRMQSNEEGTLPLRWVLVRRAGSGWVGTGQIIAASAGGCVPSGC